MTYSKEITLWCDDQACQEWIKMPGYSVQNAVSEARDRGWSSPEWDEHYCPEHS